MTIPQVTETINGFRFEWAEDRLIIIVSRLHAHKDGRLTGDIQLILGKKKQEEPLFSFNFSSAQTRKQLINSLSEKYPDWQWMPIIDELSRQVQKLSQEGEPIKELWTSEALSPPEFLLEPILLKGLPTIIFGEKGVTKSTLAYVFYICLILPWHDNGLGLIVPERSVKTVILDYELPGKLAQWNMKKLQEGLDLPPFPLYHRHCVLPLADDIEQIAKYIGEAQAEVVIIDSLGRAVGGELSKDTENANRFFVALDKLKVSPIILAQTSKSDEPGKRKTIYGNVFFTYYARSIFELCKSESLGDEVDVALFHRWSNLTAISKPMGFRLSFNEYKTTISSQAVSYGDFLEKVSRQMQILDILKPKPLKVDEIMDILNLKRSNADVTLKRLKDKNRILKLDDGRWALKSDRPI